MGHGERTAGGPCHVLPLGSTRVSAEPSEPVNPTPPFIATAPARSLLATLEHGLGARAPFLLLTGEPGTGKSMLAAEARNRWPLQDVLVIHRFGRLEAGEDIVLVITASAHREAALEACAFLMDWLKTKAPFWKLEESEKGESWVAARASDDEATKRWN